MQLTLPKEIESLVADRVASGQFASADELVTQAIRAFLSTDEFDALIAPAIEQARRGDTVDGATFFNDLYARNRSLPRG